MNDDNFRIVIPEVDTASGLALCRGNIKLYVQSLRLFAANMPATLKKMRDVSDNTLKNYSISVHSLKGMCVYIGAEETRKKAKQLEDMADAGDFKGILAQNENFIKQTEKIISNIQTWLDENSGIIDRKISAERNNG